jgi:hypothetical protein
MPDHPPPRLFRRYVDTEWGQVHCRVAEPDEITVTVYF